MVSRILTCLIGLLVCTSLLPAQEDIPANRAKQIEDAAPAKPSAQPKEGRRVLIFITPPHLMDKDPHKGYCIPYATHAMVTLGKKTGAYEPVVSGDVAMFLPENIKQFDAIVLNNASQAWITPTDEHMQRDAFRKHGESAEAVELVLRKSLLGYVQGGGGIAATHYAIGANRHWDDFHKLLGAKYAGHPWHEEVGVKLDEPDHPLVAAFKGGDFRLTEEIYQFAAPYARDNVRVLLSLDTTKTNMGVQWIKRTDGDFALAWVRPFGKGRVFYTAIGHRTELYWNPAMLRFYLDGIQFAIGDLIAESGPKALKVATPQAAEKDDGFTSIFNGKDLTGWEGDPRYWSVRDGAITGSTHDVPKLKHNNFLIWQDGKPKDFELRLRYRIIGGNSGIYYHAARHEEGDAMVGPQADFSADHKWTGVIMEWRLRDKLAERGQKVVIDEKGEKKVVGSVGDPAELLKAVKDEDWNDYRVLVRGQRTVLEINGVTMCELTDKDPRRPAAGHLALQVHVGQPMLVQFKDIRIRQFD